MADYPAMPLWTDAYLADTRHLSTVEHGAYLLLLMEAWRRPSCSLPDDDVLLARLAGLSATEWCAVKSAVMAFWSIDGRRKEWTQKRLAKERAYVAQKSRSQSDKATKRWKVNENSHAAALPKGMPEACPDDAPTPTPTPTPTVDANASTSRAAKSAGRSVDDDFRDWYAEYPHKVSRKHAADAYRKAATKATPGELLDGLRRYIRTKPPDVNWCNPATWLNGERWADAPAPKATNGARHDQQSPGKTGRKSPVIDVFLGTEHQGSGERDFFGSTGRMVRQ